MTPRKWGLCCASLFFPGVPSFLIKVVSPWILENIPHPEKSVAVFLKERVLGLITSISKVVLNSLSWWSLSDFLVLLTQKLGGRGKPMSCEFESSLVFIAKEGSRGSG